MKPYSFFKGGSQFGRDQLANRYLVASRKVKVEGRNSNDLLTLLGQPQEIEVTERNVSENWHFIYYKKYIPYNPSNAIKFPAEEGKFTVEFKDDKVVKVSAIS